MHLSQFHQWTKQLLEGAIEIISAGQKTQARIGLIRLATRRERQRRKIFMASLVVRSTPGSVQAPNQAKRYDRRVIDRLSKSDKMRLARCIGRVVAV